MVIRLVLDFFYKKINFNGSMELLNFEFIFLKSKCNILKDRKKFGLVVIYMVKRLEDFMNYNFKIS